MLLPIARETGLRDLKMQAPSRLEIEPLIFPRTMLPPPGTAAAVLKVETCKGRLIYNVILRNACNDPFSAVSKE